VCAWRWDGYDIDQYAAPHPDEERARAERILAGEVTALASLHGVSVATEVVLPVSQPGEAPRAEPVVRA